eukprot:1196198-Prorocentrum_minimum.AAC.1
MQALLGVVGRLLGPELEDSAAFYIGGLLRTLIRTLTTQISPFLPQMLSMLLQRCEGGWNQEPIAGD